MKKPQSQYFIFVKHLLRQHFMVDSVLAGGEISFTIICKEASRLEVKNW
jgi:hypothetical protein